jgi:VCBS repeat-containing protein
VSTTPTKGRVDLDPQTGSFTYTPTADIHGDDAFTVMVSDGTVTAQAEVTVKVASVNDAPVIVREPLQTPEDTALSARLMVLDADGDPITIKLLTTPRLGTITLENAATGQIVYVPRADVFGDDEVEIEAGDGRLTVRGVVPISVLSVNDAPVTSPRTITTLEDTPVEFVVEGSDVDGDRLNFEVVRPPAGGRVVVDGPRLRFEPARDAHGEATFDIVASDGLARSTPVTVTATITPVNDAPTAQSSTLTTTEDAPLKGKLRVADVDVEPLQIKIVKAPIGQLTIDDPSTGAFTYTPRKNFSGIDIFEFMVVDGSGKSARAGASVVVSEMEDPPVGYPAAITAPRFGSTTGTLQGHDPEGQPIRFRIVKQPAIGTVTLVDEKTGTFRFETRGNGSGRVGFMFVVNDGHLDSVPVEVAVEVR